MIYEKLSQHRTAKNKWALYRHVLYRQIFRRSFYQWDKRGLKMKTNIFYSQWNSYKPILDKTMTRERAAKLLRAWRNNARKNTNKPKFVFKRIAPHVYFVKVCEWDAESHTLFIGYIK